MMQSHNYKVRIMNSIKKSIISLNGQVITQNSIKFSAGEVQVKIPAHLIKSHNTVKAHICDSDGIMLLGQLAYVIRQYDNTLVLPYLPYSRYDRVNKNNDALSIKVFADLINNMNFSKVITHDCHSDVGVALLNNCTDVPQHILVMDMFDNINNDKDQLDMFATSEFDNIQKYDAIVSPDAGASKKAFKLAQILGKPLIECGKHRDFDTGNIIGFNVPASYLTDENITTVLIVDDIADGGGTFIGLAEELSKFIDNVDLYVTHGIFSKGTKQLNKNIRNIYAYHNWLTIDPDTFAANLKLC